MTRESDIEILIRGVLNTNLHFYDDPNGGYDFTCPFCGRTETVGGQQNEPTISSLKHSQSCIYLVAKDLSSKR